MKIRLFINIGHGAREDIIDTVADWGLAEGEWESMPSSEQEPYLNNWVNNYLEFGWEPTE